MRDLDQTRSMSTDAVLHRTPSVSITGTGLFTPAASISNDELVESLTIANERWNDEHAAAIEAGEIEAKPLPDGAFIEKASGIKARYVMDKVGVLDPDRMAPSLPTRGEDELSIQAEIAVSAIEDDSIGRVKEGSGWMIDDQLVITQAAIELESVDSTEVDGRSRNVIDG